MADKDKRFEDEVFFLPTTFFDSRAQEYLKRTGPKLAVEPDRVLYYRAHGIGGLNPDGNFFHVGDTPATPPVRDINLPEQRAFDDERRKNIEAGKKALEAYLQNLTPSEFLFQYRRRGLLTGDFPDFTPDLSNWQNIEFILEFERRKSLQQITPDGRLVQPIGPITTLPVTPPRAVTPIGPGIGVPVVPIPGTGDGRGRPGTPTPALPTLPGIGVPIVPGVGTGDGRQLPPRPIGPGLGGIIIVGGGVVPGSARPVDKGGNGQVPPGQIRPPTAGSGGTGQPPGFQQGFPDELFRRNPPDP